MSDSFSRAGYPLAGHHPECDRVMINDRCTCAKLYVRDSHNPREIYSLTGHVAMYDETGWPYDD